ncbi:hypothetical protein CBM2615_B60096 [Cupriavidus taiwanensis]|nr:hypothetical protein CBM2615_B60096 [Cupriavidus taiwanensis]
MSSRCFRGESGVSLWLTPLFPFAEQTKDPLLVEAAHFEQWGEYSTNRQNLGRASFRQRDNFLGRLSNCKFSRIREMIL